MAKDIPVRRFSVEKGVDFFSEKYFLPNFEWSTLSPNFMFHRLSFLRFSNSFGAEQLSVVLCSHTSDDAPEASCNFLLALDNLFGHVTFSLVFLSKKSSFEGALCLCALF